MAYVSQQLKAKLAPAIKAVCKKYGLTATIAVRHHSTLILNVKSGPIDFIGNNSEVLAKLRSFGRDVYCDAASAAARTYMDVNPYHFSDQFTGRALDFITEVMAVMNVGNWDKSDSQTDYFNVGWYVDVNIGSWDKPYVLQSSKATQPDEAAILSTLQSVEHTYTGVQS